MKRKIFNFFCAEYFDKVAVCVFMKGVLPLGIIIGALGILTHDLSEHPHNFLTGGIFILIVSIIFEILAIINYSLRTKKTK